MTTVFLSIALVILAIAVLGCAYRLIAGPSRSDRIAALDTIGINLLAMIAVFCMLLDTQALMEIILVIGILTFLGTTVMARYIERGSVIEDGDDR
ncbi:Na(+)/H(+) antiporter subunit F1 [Saccharibacillus sp. JS10]|uniref:Na(+)/H(+) antiporter subunit F1 n=1 Tax=Saccharibacillus sp. JS10 TaxID=2950552 RepID=UPI0021086B4A|nr:Na(+)/H(+) antiporter subunit F1 [Saccharibacillus sp. JS10]MCQ4088585.1 Na(+)/H(+) antiporter subunit F1 [Saccharibacillus sp. JS10]